MYSASVVPTLAVPPVCENQVIEPLPPALPLLAPVAYCPRISVARVSVRTHVDPAIPVPAVVGVGVMLLLQLLIVHRLRYDVATVPVDLKICGRVMVGAHIITPTARVMDFHAFFAPRLWSCTPPLSTLTVHRYWYNGGCVDVEPVDVSSYSCLYISSSSLTVQRLL